MADDDTGSTGGDDQCSACTEAAVATPPLGVPQKEQPLESSERSSAHHASPSEPSDTSTTEADDESTSLLRRAAPSYSSTTYPFVGRRERQWSGDGGNDGAEKINAAPRILKPSSFPIFPRGNAGTTRSARGRPSSSSSSSRQQQASYHKSFSIDDTYHGDNDDPYGSSSRYSHHQVLLKRLSYGLLFLVCSVYTVAISRGHQPRVHAPHHSHDHTIPTLLGVRHHDHDTFVNALHSKLYDAMKAATYRGMAKKRLYAFDTYGQSLRSAGGGDINAAATPKITVDRGSVSFGSPLAVTWNGHRFDKLGYSHPLDDRDVIALYCPADEANPRKFRDAARLMEARRTTAHLLEVENGETLDTVPDNQWRIGSFPTVREETCEFRLWLRSDHREKSTGEHSYSLAATTGPFFVRHGSTTPTGLHLALGNEPSEMTASFATGAGGTPIVQYGTRDDKLHHTARGTSNTYTADKLCQAPANITEPGKFTDPGMLHHVTMTELSPDTEYYYRVGVERSDSSGNLKTVHWSDVNKFVTSPKVGTNPGQNDDEPYKYVAYADQGCPGYGAKDGSKRVTRWVEREVEEQGIRAVHHFGDLSYANGAGHMWDAWTDMVSTFAKQVPLMIGVGNHEYDHSAGGESGKDPSGLSNADGFQPEWGNFGSDSAGECGVPTSRRFKMPAEKSGGNGVYWYSFDHGLVHTVMISSEHDLSPGSDQYDWLRRDLMSVDRSLTPFLIVESHRPLYNSEDVPANTVVSLAMRDEIEDLLVDHNVDMFLAGHYHAYLRTCGGLYQSKCDNGGPVHITVGSAGAELDSYPLYTQDWTTIFLKAWGYGRITVHNRTALQFEFVADEDGKVLDEFWVRKHD